MSGHLVKLDEPMLELFKRDRFKVALFGDVDHYVYMQARGGGLMMTSKNVIYAIPVRCDHCACWVKFGDAIFDGHCPNCSTPYWPEDFGKSLPGLAQIGLPELLAAVFAETGNVMVTPVTIVLPKAPAP